MRNDEPGADGKRRGEGDRKPASTEREKGVGLEMTWTINRRFGAAARAGRLLPRALRSSGDVDELVEEVWLKAA